METAVFGGHYNNSLEHEFLTGCSICRFSPGPGPLFRCYYIDAWIQDLGKASSEHRLKEEELHSGFRPGPGIRTLNPETSAPSMCRHIDVPTAAFRTGGLNTSIPIGGQGKCPVPNCFSGGSVCRVCMNMALLFLHDLWEENWEERKRGIRRRDTKARNGKCHTRDRSRGVRETRVT